MSASELLPAYRQQQQHQEIEGQQGKVAECLSRVSHLAPRAIETRTAQAGMAWRSRSKLATLPYIADSFVIGSASG